MAGFDRELSVIGDVESFVKGVRDGIAIGIDQRLVRETPVDTGRARANWLVSVGRSSEKQQPPGPATAAIDQGVSTTRSAPPFTELFIQNNLPYIQRLNEGWSKQAPSRYIDVIITQEVARGD